jgi:nucleoside-diphosphate-sugar epimerase
MANPLVSIIEKDVNRIFKAVSDLELLGNKKILVTGASGLIGTYLIASIKELVRQKKAIPASVVAIAQSEIAEPLVSFLDFKGASVVRGDLTDFEFLKKLGKFDYIIHAAGYGQPGRFMEDQVKTLKLNTSTMFSLFDCLEENGHFLFISTSEVYSGLPNPPYCETQIGTTNTTHARSCYIEAKRCGEAICNAYRSRGIKASSARLALAYGPGTKAYDRRVLNSFIERALLQRKIGLQDHGLAKRTYCYVADAVEILWHILFSCKEPIYNVGGVSKTSVVGMAREIGMILDVPVCLPKTAIALSGAPEDVFLDMTLIEKEFGKADYITFDEGLKNTIEWQKNLYSTL